MSQRDENKNNVVSSEEVFSESAVPTQEKKSIFCLYGKHYKNSGLWLFYFTVGFVLALFDSSFSFYELSISSFTSSIINAISPFTAFILILIFSFAIICFQMIVEFCRGLFSKNSTRPFEYPLSESVAISVKVQILTIGLIVGLIVFWAVVPEARMKIMGWDSYLALIGKAILINLYFIIPCLLIYGSDLITTRTLLTDSNSIIYRYPKSITFLLGVLFLILSVGLFIYLRAKMGV
ncbi:hypothetical protein GKC56_03370 [Neisseriaceae bacterium PsAf]|nr:hypothetical protein [Neisseriaceae bacterium PsAf]